MSQAVCTVAQCVALLPQSNKLESQSHHQKFIPVAFGQGTDKNLVLFPVLCTVVIYCLRGSRTVKILSLNFLQIHLDKFVSESFQPV